MVAVEQLITDNLDIWSSAMKAKSAAGRGTSKKIDLYGIKKLRGLILELAVRGLLVPQDANDEPTSVLLEKISSEKKQLIIDKKLKKSKILPEINENDKQFKLAKGWSWVRFGNIAQHNSGKTLDKGRNTGESRKYLTTSNLYWGRFKLENIREMLIKDEELEKCSARAGDLLICEGGEAGRAAVWEGEDEICFQNHIHRARFFGELNPYYMYRFFEKLTATGEINQHRKGVGISNMSGKSLSLIALPLPPLAEQHRIVAKVDELMALCDQLEQQTEISISAHQKLAQTLLEALTNTSERDGFNQAWERIAEHFDTFFTTEWSIDQLKQTILQLAVMGKLVPQNPNDEPASELLKKIATEKAKLLKEEKIKKQKPLSPIEENEKPFKLPVGWEWARIGDASYSTDYGLSDKSFISESGVPVLTMGHIQSGHVLLGGQKVVPRTVKSLPELYLKNRDLLYNRTNSAELVGKTGIYIGNDKEYTFASYLIRIRTDKESLLPEFINMNMLSPKFRITQIDPHLKQQCGQANVNGTIMKNMLVVIAPESEITRIVTKVEKLMVICETLKTKIKSAQISQLHLADTMAEQALN